MSGGILRRHSGEWWITRHDTGTNHDAKASTYMKDEQKFVYGAGDLFL
ncbi:hypothetical protein MM817_01806 [Acidibacillus sp. S0AB]|uniref:Uncharacterized protein n=1 Tax=Sulfoacidibacillus ferrooxidans TaxID=2005001 RepID=A0A9X1VBF0_9BACL|nr:hypothetical protein [Sulfoacidibacillus ferrooxidans]